jgi:type I restriction enzyme S subunit
MSEWQACTLSDVLKFGNGKSRPKEYGTIPVYGGNGILDYTNSSNYQDETIVIGRVGAYCGATYYEDKQIWVSDNALSAKALNRNDAKFLYYFLKNLDLNQFAQGSSHPLLTQTLLNSIEVVVPSSPLEQKAIASVLSSLDDKIDLLHRQNKTLEAMAETLFRQWFIEEAKEDWETTPLSNIFDFLEGPGIRNWQYVEEGINFINIRLIDRGEINLLNANKISQEEAYGKYQHFLLQEGDLIMSTSGTLGKSAIVRKYHLPLCLNTSVIRFRPKQEIYREFMYAYMTSRVFLDELEASASGSVQLNFGPTHLKKIHIKLPPEDLVYSYHLATKAPFSKIQSNFENIEILKKLRDTLLPKLMNGEVRVQYQTE